MSLEQIGHHVKVMAAMSLKKRQHCHGNSFAPIFLKLES